MTFETDSDAEREDARINDAAIADLRRQNAELTAALDELKLTETLCLKYRTDYRKTEEKP